MCAVRTWPYLAYICVLYVHNLESTRKILWTRLKKGNGGLEKLNMDTLDSSMTKKRAAELKAKGKKSGSACDLLAVRERMLKFYSD